jgi:hypothetical protein
MENLFGSLQHDFGSFGRVNIRNCKEKAFGMQ